MALEGKKVSIGGREFVVPPATLADQRKVLALWRGLGEAAKERFSDAHITTAAGVIHALLVRNYPDLTVAQVEGLVPSRPSKCQACMRAVEVAAELADEEGEAKGEAGSP